MEDSRSWPSFWAVTCRGPGQGWTSVLSVQWSPVTPVSTDPSRWMPRGRIRIKTTLNDASFAHFARREGAWITRSLHHNGLWPWLIHPSDTFSFPREEACIHSGARNQDRYPGCWLACCHSVADKYSSSQKKLLGAFSPQSVLSATPPLQHACVIYSCQRPRLSDTCRAVCLSVTSLARSSRRRIMTF